MTERYLLCRPQGGLNDILCQIERCCRYAEQSGRAVIVETDLARSRYFRESFSRHFQSTQPRLHLDAAGFRSSFDSWDVFPAALAGRVNGYSTARDWQRRLDLDEQSRAPLTFDFTRPYPHKLLVHHQSGGGRLSLFALLRMQVTGQIVAELGERLRAIGGPYAAVHVRHSDLRSDYAGLLEKLRSRRAARLFLATDNAAVLDEFRSGLGEATVFSFSSLPGERGQALHRMVGSAPEQSRRNREAVLDLLTLAFSAQLHLVPVVDYAASKYSGYSMLASQLWHSKVVLKYLLGPAGLSIGLG